MIADRLNPVVLITGVSARAGASFSRILSSRAQGGLILTDADDKALAAVADELESRGVVPERVSTLAFDAADEARWGQAEAFIESQYGRLDWAVIDLSAAPPPADSDLVQWGRPSSPAIDTAYLSLRAVMRLMQTNSNGGAVIVTAPAALLSGADTVLPRLVTSASREAAHDNIRINTLVLDPGDTWPQAPHFDDLVSQGGSERAALDLITAMAAPAVRYASSGDITPLAAILLSDASPLTGATLIVDGGHAL